MSGTAKARAVHAEGLSKAYLLWDNPRDRLKHPVRNMLTRWLPISPKTYYREFWALRDVSFTLDRGETLGIIGRNGSGKSTLLQMICGTLMPTSGTFSTDGRVSALLELGSGFNPEFSGKDNVYMNASILGLSKSEIDARYGTICDFADIGDFIDQPVRMYSSGMYVRLAFAIAAHVDAEILVVDEALAVGDAFFTQKCMRYMRKFRETGSLLFVSHDTGAVVNLCDRAILLDHGAVKATGSAREICELYLEETLAEQQPVDGVKGLRSSAGTSGADSALPAGFDPSSAGTAGDGPDEVVDQRLRYVNLSRHRNDIEVFHFIDSERAFGSGGARIVDVRLVDPASGRRLTWVVGGERVALQVQCSAERDLQSPIVGFYVKDRLGQALFGDNTYLTYQGKNASVGADGVFRAKFAFRMPVLPEGDYCFAVALADGTQMEHVQLHWIHEALFFASHASSVVTGLVGVPMTSIVIEGLSPEGESLK